MERPYMNFSRLHPLPHFKILQRSLNLHFKSTLANPASQPPSDDIIKNQLAYLIAINKQTNDFLVNRYLSSHKQCVLSGARLYCHLKYASGCNWYGWFFSFSPLCGTPARSNQDLHNTATISSGTRSSYYISFSAKRKRNVVRDYKYSVQRQENVIVLSTRYWFCT